MSLRFEQILTEGIAQLSYIVGDDAVGTAAVIDPRPDVEVYLALARQHKLAITHVFGNRSRFWTRLSSPGRALTSDKNRHGVAARSF